MNKDAIFPEKQPLQAFSLFPDKIDLSDSLTAPVTDEEFLRANKDKMRCRMEAFITNLQGKIIKSLQEVEPEKKFAVDRWARKEVGRPSLEDEYLSLHKPSNFLGDFKRVAVE